MSKEGIEYARALTGELRRLHERNEAVDRQRQTLVQEYDRVYDKLLGMLRDLGQPLVVDGMLYQLSANGSITDQPVIVDGAAAPKGKGYYDPDTQGVVRWQQLGNAHPPDDRIVLVSLKGYRQAIPMLYRSSEQEWEDWHGNTSSASGSDLWAELPLPPRAML